MRWGGPVPLWLPKGPTEQGSHAGACTQCEGATGQDRSGPPRAPSVFSIINLLLESPESHSLLVHWQLWGTSQEVPVSLSLFVPTLFPLNSQSFWCKPRAWWSWKLPPLPVTPSGAEQPQFCLYCLKLMWGHSCSQNPCGNLLERCVHGRQCSGRGILPANVPTGSPHSPCFWRRSKGGSRLAKDSQEHVCLLMKWWPNCTFCSFPWMFY